MCRLSSTHGSQNYRYNNSQGAINLSAFPKLKELYKKVPIPPYHYHWTLHRASHCGHDYKAPTKYRCFKHYFLECEENVFKDEPGFLFVPRVKSLSSTPAALVRHQNRIKELDKLINDRPCKTQGELRNLTTSIHLCKPLLLDVFYSEQRYEAMNFDERLEEVREFLEAVHKMCVLEKKVETEKEAKRLEMLKMQKIANVARPQLCFDCTVNLLWIRALVKIILLWKAEGIVADTVATLQVRAKL